jgi:hypothetical protein
MKMITIQKKQAMKFLTPLCPNFIYAILFLITIHSGWTQSNGQPTDRKTLTQTVLHMDSLFWQAYNTCDVDKMATFFTDDMEFYHDKGGLTTPLSKLVTSMKTGLCGREDWRLRREAVEGTVKVFPMDNYGAILSGDHVFYVLEKDKKERLDGLAKFTHVWKFKDNEWKMHRVLSYDHGPAPYMNKRKEIVLPVSLLKQYSGKYESPKAGSVTLSPEGNTLKFAAGNFQITLYPESETFFFVKERDLQFEIVKEGKLVTKIVVHENGQVVEEAKRVN